MNLDDVLVHFAECLRAAAKNYQGPSETLDDERHDRTAAAVLIDIANAVEDVITKARANG